MENNKFIRVKNIEIDNSLRPDSNYDPYREEDVVNLNACGNPYIIKRCKMTNEFWAIMVQYDDRNPATEFWLAPNNWYTLIDDNKEISEKYDNRY